MAELPITDARDEDALRGLYAAGWDPPQAVVAAVRAILDDVRARGDEALVDYTRRWDDAGASLATLRVDVPSRKVARGLVPGPIAAGLELARERIADFHARQLPDPIDYHAHDMTRYAFLARPLAAIGAYVPGGSAPLPSTVLMTCVPAKVAGVERIVVVTPPQRDGRGVNPAVLYACALVGVDELYAVGGAQAVGALAYGTATIAPVDKIVGPGNVYVTEAKRQVFGACGIDGLAGPSEVLVVADAAADPELVAGELIAQAEHDPLARVAAVSRERGLLERVAALLDGPLGRASGRDAIVGQVLAERTWLVHAADEAAVLAVIDRFAPEHLALMVADPYSLLPHIRRAGAIFVGDQTPVAAGDYLAGTNHTLPTSGSGRYASGLRTADYLRTMTLVENSRARMAADAAPLAALAEFEGLPAHARTARIRVCNSPGDAAAGVQPRPMRLLPAVVRLAAAVALFFGLSLVAAHQHAQAGDELAAPFDVATMDRSANACTDFFAYATGGWRKAHPIPAAYSEYGYIEQLVDHTREIVRATLEEARQQPGPAGGDQQKIGTLYGACMDTAAIERQGLAPLAPELARIAALRDRPALAAEVAHLHWLGVDAGFALGPTQDFHDSTQVIAEVDQSGIGLPERDYYLRQDAESAKLRTQYLAHVAKMLALGGDAAASADARAVVAFETVLARGSKPAADLRDPEAVYHPYSVAAVGALAPHAAFTAYLRSAEVPLRGKINVAQPQFLRVYDTALASAPLGTWRAYLRWRLLDAYASALPKRFDDEEFAFNGRLLRGRKEQLPRWKRCVEVDNGLLGEAVGRAYVAKEFSPAAKQRALDMTIRIRDAYRAEIGSLAWMTPATKRTAVAKLDAMGLKVGYPDRWRSYAGFDVRPGAFVDDVARGRAFERRYQLAQIGKPLDRGRWGMTPQTVNAYNDTQRNEIVLPAAQLQRPFFDAAADDASNLGATGAGTVGHEMTHGFDDEGHKFDLHGNVRNWWTARDLKQFDARANCVIRQFDRTVAVGTTHYQGRLVAGEAIADLGGTVLGYRALETH